MIFKKKDLVSVDTSKGSRRYKVGDPSILDIYCLGIKFNNRIRYWLCKVYTDIPKVEKELLWEFVPTHPGPWQEKWFLEGLNESMDEKGGKYKLIKAIYNDFD